MLIFYLFPIRCSFFYVIPPRVSIFQTIQRWTLQVDKTGYYLQTDDPPFDVEGYYFHLHHPDLFDCVIYPQIRWQYYYHHPNTYIYMYRDERSEEYKIHYQPYNLYK